MTISERLKSLRLATGKTQKEIAEQLSILPEAYRRWENGRSNPKKDSLEKLAKVFNVSVSYLLGETNIRSSYEIIEIMEQLNEPRQENTLIYAKEQLSEQKYEEKFIELKKSLVPYQQATEQALSAGLGNGYTDDVDTTTVYWNKKVDYDIGIPIKGDSMEPEYHYGQTALIKYQSKPDYDGQVCAVDDVSIGNAFIKCVTVEEDGLLLQSLNDLVDANGGRIFPDIKLSWDHNPRIIGKVVAAFKPININDIQI